MKFRKFATILFLGSVAIATPLQSQTWQKISPSGASGSSTACAFRLASPTYARIAPVTTTVQYFMIGGGAGGYGRTNGGAGGETRLVVNGSVVATASGGATSGANGTAAQGSLTLNAGDLFEVFIGGGGGGGGDASTHIGRPAVDGANGSSWNFSGGGGGGWGSGGGAGSRDDNGDGGLGGSNGSDGNPSATSEPGGKGILSGTAWGQGGVDTGNAGTGGSAGGLDLTYEASGCWIN